MKKVKESIAKYIFLIAGIVAIISVLAITLYMFLKGAPALFQVGAPQLLFGTVWKPTAAEPHYGIFYIILSSVV